MVQTDKDRKMGLDLDLSMYSLPKPLSQFLQEVSRIDDNHSKLSEIDSYVEKLQEEKKKINVFKRELPLCMLLLNEAIDALKEEAKKGAKSESDNSNKNTWMSSAQLWISNPSSQSQLINEEKEEDRCMTRNPFNLPSHTLAPAQIPTPLSLMTQTSDMMMECSRNEHNRHHIQKKEQRRKWSQDLHRKFVDALHKLGGSQVATPKQIRDLMKVDGLTNDEVKSHLQKYRLHIRKHPLHPVEIMTYSDDQRSLVDKEPQSLISLSRSDSPQSPLVKRRLFSNNIGGYQIIEGDNEGEEEEKSDGRSWRNESKKIKKRQVLDLEL